MDNIYRENILNHFRNPKNYGRLKDPEASFFMENSLCGDSVGIEVKTRGPDKVIKEIAFWGKGCVISVASASMLTDRVIGMKMKKAYGITKDDFMEILGINLSPVRMKCALLPLEVLMKTLALVKK